MHLKHLFLIGTLVIGLGSIPKVLFAAQSDAIRGRAAQAQVKSMADKLIGFRSFAFIPDSFNQSEGPDATWRHYRFYKTATYACEYAELLYTSATDGEPSGTSFRGEELSGELTLAPSKTGSVGMPKRIEVGEFIYYGSPYATPNPVLESEGMPAAIVANTLRHIYVYGGTSDAPPSFAANDFLCEWAWPRQIVGASSDAYLRQGSEAEFFPSFTFSAVSNPQNDYTPEMVWRGVLAKFDNTSGWGGSRLFGEDYFHWYTWSGHVTAGEFCILNFASETTIDGFVYDPNISYMTTPLPPGLSTRSGTNPDGSTWASTSNNIVHVDLSNPDTVADVLARNPESSWTTSIYTDAGIGQAWLSSGVSISDRAVSAQKCSIRVGASDTNQCLPPGQYIAYITLMQYSADNGGTHTNTVLQQSITIDESGISKEAIELPYDNDHHYVVSEIWLQPLQRCATCSQEGAPPGFGGGPEGGSVEFNLTLGAANPTLGPAVLHLYADHITNDLYSVDALQFIPTSGDTTTQEIMINGHLRQIAFQGGLLDAVATGDQSYELRYYTADHVGSPDTSGVFAVSGDPYVTWVVKNPDTASGAVHHLSIARVAGGKSIETLYAEDSNTGNWTVSEGNGLRVTTEEVMASPPGERDLLVTVADADGNVASKKQYRFLQASIGWIKVGEINDPDGRALTKIFDSLSVADAAINADQAAATYSTSQLYGGGQLANTQEGFPGGVSRTTTYNYTTIPDLDGDGQPEYIQQTVVTPAGQAPPADSYGGGGSLVPSSAVEPPVNPLTYRIQFTKNFVDQGGTSFVVAESIVGASATASWSDWRNLVTKERYYAAGPFGGQLAYRLTPDQVLTTVHLSLDAATGAVTRVESVGAPSSDLEMVVDGTETTTMTNRQGYVASRIVKDIASGINSDSMTVLSADEFGRPTVIGYLDGSTENRTYSACCSRLESSSRNGLTTLYAYDDLGRLTRTTVQTAGGIVLSSTRQEYDAAGRVTGTWRVADIGDEKLQELTTYDVAGYAVQREDAVGNVTTITEQFPAFSVLSGGGVDGTPYRITTTTYADGGTRVQKFFNGGFQAEISGSAVSTPRTFSYGTDPQSGNAFVVESAIGTSERTTTFRNSLGQTVAVRFADNAQQQYNYTATGQLAESIDPDGVITLYAYNARGERTTEAIDVDGSGVFDFGSDRITQTVVDYLASRGTPVRRTRTLVWAQDGEDSPQVLNTVEASVDGLRSWQTTEGVTTSTEIAFDGQGGRTETVINPDASQHVRSYIGGLLMSDVLSAGGTPLMSQTYTYDAYGRVATVTDARNGTTNFTYYDDDKVHTITTPDPDTTKSGDGYDRQTTTYEYNLGRLWKTTQPGAGVVTNEYYPTGLLKKTSGARTYPEEFTYDGQGRLKTVTTWRDFAGDSGKAVTTWNYDPARGWLSGKVYADGLGTAYTYTPAGRLASRASPRGVTAAYVYSSCGDLASISYTDATPEVDLQYDRLGRLSGKTDGTGSSTYTYQGLTSLQASETCDSGLVNGISLSRTYDPLVRLASATLLDSNSSPLASASYAYDALSRLQTVTSGANSATYGYLDKSPLVGSVTFRNNGIARLTTTKTYDSLNRLAAIYHLPAAPGLSPMAYNYTYNSANQRTQATQADGSYWRYSYDPLGQVTSGTKLLPNGVPQLGFDHHYVYDDIGNRTATTVNGQTSTYTPNDLNQYSQRSVPGFVDVAGSADEQARVTVTFPAASASVLQTTRQGEFFYKQLVVDNASVSQYAQMKITGVRNLVGPNGEDAVTEETRSAFVAKTPEVFSYDEDGNLTADGRWSYTWDAENRLVACETTDAAVSAGLPKQKLEFVYDVFGRRIQKKVSDGTGVVTVDTRFVYDGWNLWAELDGLNSNIALRTCVWGSDLSGSLQGAGGAGGLLFVQTGDATQSVAHDGNGNVIGLVDQGTGALNAEYDYNAFGETVELAGSAAAANPFRFSTKYSDAESRFIYYGFRYYCPATGRWLSRDPSEEQGGANLYGFVRNNAIDAWDPFGLDPWEGNVDLTINLGPIQYNRVGGANGYTMGLLGLLGVQRDLHFGPDDAATHEMQQSRVVDLDRDRARKQLKVHCKNSGGKGPVEIPLGQELGEISPLGYPFLFAKDLLTNNTAAFIGSWTGGTMKATEIDCCKGTAAIHFRGINISGMVSASHLPPWLGSYGASLFRPNPFGSKGPLHDFTQTFDWDENISF